MPARLTLLIRAKGVPAMGSLFREDALYWGIDADD